MNACVMPPRLAAHALRFLALVAFAIAASTASARKVEHVFVVSFDQTGPTDVAGADMPVYKAMAAEGAHTWEAFTIVPSITLPSHVSMLTGVGIQKHQIQWNDIWTPEKPRLSVPTMFELAKARGLTTAAFASKQKFKIFETRGGIDRFEVVENGSNPAVAAAAIKAISELKPNLCFVHFGEPDAMGHKFGVESPEKKRSLAEADAALKALRDAVSAAGIADTSVFILTADHGGHDVVNQEGRTVGTHGSADPADVLIPWIAWGADVKPRFEITAAVVQYDTAATALWLLGVDIPESFWGRPVKSAFAD